MVSAEQQKRLDPFEIQDVQIWSNQPSNTFTPIWKQIISNVMTAQHIKGIGLNNAINEELCKDHILLLIL